MIIKSVIAATNVFVLLFYVLQLCPASIYCEQSASTWGIDRYFFAFKNITVASGYESTHVLSAGGISPLPGAGKKNMALLNYYIGPNYVPIGFECIEASCYCTKSSQFRNLRYAVQRNCSNEHVINKPLLKGLEALFSEVPCNGLTGFPLPKVTASGTHAVLSLPIQDYPMSMCLPTTMQNIQRNSILDLGPIDICQTAFVQLCLPLELW